MAARFVATSKPSWMRRAFPSLDVVNTLWNYSRRYYDRNGRQPRAFVVTPLAAAWIRFTEHERLVPDYLNDRVDRIFGVELRVREEGVLYFVGEES